MLLVVCPNLAVDRILEVPGFRPSIVQRSANVSKQPGGKGSNVARVFRQLGGEVVLTGLVGRANASSVTVPLRTLGIEVDAVEAYEGASRTCTIVIDPSGDSHPTVINEESPIIEAGADDRFMRVVEKWLPRVAAVLVTGSLPRGLKPEFYARLVERARSLQKFVALDAVVHAEPTLLKLNAQEFAALVGLATTEEADITHYLRTTDPAPAEQTIVTFGEAGAVLKTSSMFVKATPPVIFRTNPIGSGDSFVAGYLREFLASHDIERAFKLGLASAASDAETMRPGYINVEDINPLLDRVTLSRL